MQPKFVLCMIKYKIKRKIVDCEKMESVTSHDLYPLPLSQTVTLSQTTSPLWSVTYFMDGPKTEKFLSNFKFLSNCPMPKTSFLKFSDPKNVSIYAHAWTYRHICFMGSFPASHISAGTNVYCLVTAVFESNCEKKNCSCVSYSNY